MLCCGQVQLVLWPRSEQCEQLCWVSKALNVVSTVAIIAAAAGMQCRASCLHCSALCGLLVGFCCLLAGARLLLMLAAPVEASAGAVSPQR
jgi:hypothetical protein